MSLHPRWCSTRLSSAASPRIRKAPPITSMETKTCNEEGQTGCFADVDGYPLTVSFRWQATYRVGTNPWNDLGPVTPFATVAYPVDEIISRIDSTG